MSFSYKISGKQHVFIHIPKNGGKSLIKALRDFETHRPKISHLTYLETKNIVKECDNYFCTIRNPWERMVSYYNYISQKSPKEHGVKDLNLKIRNGFSFDEFVDEIIKDDRLIFRPQIEYMTDKEGVICVKAIKLENIKEEINKYLINNGYKGVDINIPQINTSKHEHYSSFYKNESAIEKVCFYEKDVIKEFNYNFKK